MDLRVKANINNSLLLISINLETINKLLNLNINTNKELTKSIIREDLYKLIIKDHAFKQ